MSNKITMLKVWYYPNEWAYVYGNKRIKLIRPEEFESFRKSVFTVLKVKRKKIKIS